MVLMHANYMHTTNLKQCIPKYIAINSGSYAISCTPYNIENRVTMATHVCAATADRTPAVLVVRPFLCP